MGEQQFPEEIRLEHGNHIVRYRLDANKRAVPDEGEVSHIPGYVLVEGGVSRDTERPVYRREPGGEPAVVTGRVHLRAASSEIIARLRDDLDRLGFDVDDVPAHAPHTCWLRPRPGRTAECLAGWTRLLALPGVEHAEPQMLRAAERRAAPGR